MTTASETIELGAGDHIVQFYEHDSELFRTVGEYLAHALATGGVAIVIATEAHRRGFELELEAAGIESEAALATSTLVWLDAAATLASFTQDGRVEGDAFREVIGAVVRDAADTGRPVCAYGEMVALLWDAGDVLAAIDLEKLWNDLGLEIPFSLMCAYHRQSVSGPEHAEAFDQVCHLHSSVLAPAPRDTLTGDSPAVEVSRQFAADSGSPRAARQFVTDALREWGHSGTVLDDAQLVLSELATNAVVHACSSFSVVARSENASVRLSVRDHSPLQPTLRANGPLALSGRGLHLVAALTRDWGVEATSDGKTVWAELPSVH
jgi:anti-sigma regulatory factor (Ser/Thr protein kinase)